LSWLPAHNNNNRTANFIMLLDDSRTISINSRAVGNESPLGMYGTDDCVRQ
jgi:hypothetical protein